MHKPESTPPPGSQVYELVPMAHVADVEASIEFYALLGFSVRERVAPGGKTHWAWLTSGRGHLMLATGEPVAAEQQSILLYLYTQDVAAMRAHLLSRGLADGGPFCGPARGQGRVVFELTHPVYMPEGEIRVHDLDRFCLLIGQCELRT